MEAIESLKQVQKYDMKGDVCQEHPSCRLVHEMKNCLVRLHLSLVRLIETSDTTGPFWRLLSRLNLRTSRPVQDLARESGDTLSTPTHGALSA